MAIELTSITRLHSNLARRMWLIGSDRCRDGIVSNGEKVGNIPRVMTENRPASWLRRHQLRRLLGYRRRLLSPTRRAPLQRVNFEGLGGAHHDIATDGSRRLSDPLCSRAIPYGQAAESVGRVSGPALVDSRNQRRRMRVSYARAGHFRNLVGPKFGPVTGREGVR